MKIEQSQLIKELWELTHSAKIQVAEFQNYTPEELSFKASASEWSILECIEHLCLYGKFYLPEIDQQLSRPSNGAAKHFKSGLMGNFFVNMIKPSNTKKIRATREMDTTGSKLSVSSINQFIKQLDWLDTLLVKAQDKDLNRIKTAISLSKMIKLHLGDTLRFVVYHNERHILQAKKIKLGKHRQAG